ELLATWGNLAHRVLTFTYRHFQGRVPTPSDLAPGDTQLLGQVDGTLAAVAENIGLCRFRAGIEAAMALARQANRHLEESSPWKHIGEDRQRAATALYTSLCVINALKVALYPYLPFTCQRLHTYLGYQRPLEAGGWQVTRPQPGQPLAEPQPLFRKLDPSLVEEEGRRLEA
ncbi:MAG: methionine--tRNA ligase, partial [Dehalococcoidia bacterium]